MGGGGGPEKLVLVLFNCSSIHELIILRTFCQCFGYRKFSLLCQEAEKLAKGILGLISITKNLSLAGSVVMKVIIHYVGNLSETAL
jgi:hypothetical protein